MVNLNFLEPRGSEEFGVFMLAINWVVPCTSMVVGSLLLLLTRLSRFFSKFHITKIILVLPGFSWLFYLNTTIFINMQRDWRQWFYLVPLLVMSFVILMGTYYRVKVFRE